MKISGDIFKAYDIRGKYPSEVNEEMARRLGNAVVVYLSGLLKKTKLKVLVCRDVRLSSPRLSAALIEGVTAAGSEIIDVGIGTTPYFYFLMHHVKPDGGIMVTASHNPAEYNGFKIRSRGGKPVSLNTGLKKIKTLMVKKEIARSGRLEVINYKDYSKDYLQFLSKDIHIGPLRVVIDAAGGSTVYFLPKLLNQFPDILYKPIFFEPDGSFKKHSPNPLLSEAQQSAKKELTQGQFRFGAIFDGDGDRVVFLDEKGNFIRQDFISALLAQKGLNKRKGETFILTTNASKGVREFIKEHGGKVKLSPVGYTNVERAMHSRNAFLGVELSGKLYFRDFFCEESGFMAFLYVAQIVSSSHRPLSQLIKPAVRYISSGEINFSVKDKKTAIARIKKYYRGAKMSFLDGITVEFPDWWFNVRPSNTEPLVRLVVEAKDQKSYDEKLKEVESLVKGE